MKNPIHHNQASFVSEDGMVELSVAASVYRSILVPEAMLKDEETKQKFLEGLYEGLDAQILKDLQNKIDEIEAYRRWKKEKQPAEVVDG